MLTSDRKEYIIGQEGFEDDWLHPENTFPYMEEVFNSEDCGKWFRISKKHASERIYCRKELQSQINHVTEKIRKRDEQDRKQSEEHFERVLLKPDSFGWHKLYYNNCIPKDEDTEKYLLQGYYLLLFKKIDECRIDGSMMTIASDNKDNVRR